MKGECRYCEGSARAMGCSCRPHDPDCHHTTVPCEECEGTGRAICEDCQERATDDSPYCPECLEYHETEQDETLKTLERAKARLEEALRDGERLDVGDLLGALSDFLLTSRKKRAA